MKNLYRISVLFVVLLISVIGCSKQNEIRPINVETKSIMQQLRDRDIKKWAEEKQLQKEQDEKDEEFNNRVAKMYDKYWEALRAYKKSDHKIVYGWFGGWSATEGMEKSFLRSLPDSVDVVSIWGGTSPFDEKDPRYADLKYVQEVKGLKVLLCWQTGTSGLGLPGGVDEFNKRHEGKNNVEKAVAYAQELTKFIKDHNFNGYDIDWEPTAGDHDRSKCSNLYSDCDNTANMGKSAPIKAFIDEMGKSFGPMQSIAYSPRNTETMFLFDGDLDDMAKQFPEKGKFFNYFLAQNYKSEHTPPPTGLSTIEGFEKSKYIMCDEFEKDGGAETGGICHKDGKVCAELKAQEVVKNGYGGWGAYHIELEEPFNYRYVRSVTRIMNPRDNYKDIREIK